MKNYPICCCILCILTIITAIPCVTAINASNYVALYYDNLDTRSSAQDAVNNQTAMGYNATAFTNSNTSFAYNQMVNDNIFFFNGHGFAGGIQFEDNKSIVASDDQSPTSLSDFDNNQLVLLQI